MIRKQFLLSTATICLMLASGLVYAQSPADAKKDEPQKERVQKNDPAKGAEPRSDVKGHDKSSEQTQKTPAAQAEKSGASKQDEKERAGNDAARQHGQSDMRHDSKNAASEKPAAEKSGA